MHKRILWSLFALFLFACTSDNEFIDSKVDQYIKSQTSFALFDTLSVNLSTVFIDSIQTSNTDNLLVGKYIDSELGTIVTSSYFELDLPAVTSLDEDEVYDSLTMVLKYSDLVYGDTLQVQTLKVYRLLEELEPDDQGLIYNTSSFKHAETPIGEVSFIPRPYKDDSIVIRLDDNLGLDFFEKMQEGENEMTDAAKFKEYFNGLVLVSDEQSTAVLSFIPDSTSFLSLHSHLPGLIRTEKQRKFSLSTTGTYFNHIECDRSSTSLEQIRTQRVALPSSETNSKAFIQSGAGIVMRVNLPSLQRLLEFDTGNLMYKAELVLRLYPNSEREISPPEKLLMYYTDKYNNLVTEVLDSDSETIYSNHYSDDIYDEYNYYTFDLTQLLYDELSDGYVDDGVGFIVTVPESEFKGSLSRMVVDARGGSQYRPVLNIYYVFFE